MQSEMLNEQRVRRAARRVGYRVHKARGAEHLNNRGKFQLVDDRNMVVMGDDYDADLAAVAAFLADV